MSQLSLDKYKVRGKRELNECRSSKKFHKLRLQMDPLGTNTPEACMEVSQNALIIRSKGSSISDIHREYMRREIRLLFS